MYLAQKGWKRWYISISKHMISHSRSTCAIVHFAGEPCEIFHCVLVSKSFLEKMTVIEHTLPFFLPIRELESDLLSSNAIVCFLKAVYFTIGVVYKALCANMLSLTEIYWSSWRNFTGVYWQERAGQYQAISYEGSLPHVPEISIFKFPYLILCSARNLH
jgi:hypothetical protein